jgi:hypothetical protein
MLKNASKEPTKEKKRNVNKRFVKDNKKNGNFEVYTSEMPLNSLSKWCLQKRKNETLINVSLKMRL